jgi:D-beta-D-heptose 7-phosphate kinase/D-beta-D-heptose 1-phosphate adenosyltransferase
MPEQKIITDLAFFLSSINRKNEKIVFTNGCLDLLHEGHLLREARKRGDMLFVAVNTDDSVKKLKGNSRPVEPLEKRMAKLTKIKEVDYILPFSEETQLSIIHQVQPDILVKGGDYQKETVAGSHLESEVVIISLPGDYSTTKIIESNKN